MSKSPEPHREGTGLGREWRRVVDADALGPGERVPVELGDGTELVVWRAADGAPCVMDARCPHQWSHLGHEAVVDGDELVCTTHFWRFDRRGSGCKQAMNGRRDEKAPVPTYPCREANGALWVRLDDR